MPTKPIEIPRKTAKEVIECWDDMFSQRTVHENTWGAITRVFNPTANNFFNQRVEGEKVDIDLYDSTPIWAGQIWAAGMHAYNTNPAEQWYDIEMQDKKLNKSSEARSWMQGAKEISFDMLNQSNWNKEIVQCYQAIPLIGNSPIFLEPDAEDDIRFQALPMYQVCFAEDASGRIDTVYRKYKMSVRQVYMKFGARSGKTVLKKWEAKKYHEKVDIIHAIEPRFIRDVSKADNVNLPVAEYYVNVEDQVKMRESGFHEFPVMVGRYAQNSGEVYAYGAGHIELANANMLQDLAKTLIKTAGKVMSPPLVLPHDGYVMPIKTGADAVNYRLKQGKAGDKIETLPVSGNPPIGREMQEDYRRMVRATFLTDLFTSMFDTHDMTAEEWRGRRQQDMLILGPILGGIQRDVLQPAIERTINIGIRRKRIPPPPDSIRDQRYKIVYISPLARAQRLTAVSSMTDYLLIIGEMAKIFPDVIDVIKSDAYAERIAEIKGIDQTLITDPKERDQIRKLKAQIAQMEQMLMQAQAAAKAFKDAGQGEKMFKEAASGPAKQ